MMNRSLANLALFVAVLALVPAAWEVASASRLRLEPVPRQDRSRSHRAKVSDQVVTRAAGSLSYSPRQGLSLDGVRVLIGPSTGIYPTLENGNADLRALDGARATLFGRETALGLKVTFLVWRPAQPRLADVSTPAAEEPGRIPSEVDPTVGRCTDEAPR